MRFKCKWNKSFQEVLMLSLIIIERSNSINAIQWVSDADSSQRLAKWTKWIKDIISLCGTEIIFAHVLHEANSNADLFQEMISPRFSFLDLHLFPIYYSLALAFFIKWNLYHHQKPLFITSHLNVFVILFLPWLFGDTRNPRRRFTYKQGSTQLSTVLVFRVASNDSADFLESRDCIPISILHQPNRPQSDIFYTYF